MKIYVIAGFRSVAENIAGMIYREHVPPLYRTLEDARNTVETYYLTPMLSRYQLYEFTVQQTPVQTQVMLQLTGIYDLKKWQNQLKK